MTCIVSKIFNASFIFASYSLSRKFRILEEGLWREQKANQAENIINFI